MTKSSFLFKHLVLCPLILLSFFPLAAQQKQIVTPNIPQLLKDHKITAENRQASIVFTQDQKIALHVDHKMGAGAAWFNNISFSTGAIEFDVKGNNTPQGSFVGIAFHKQGNAYDAIYFRPFNFHAATSLSRSHAVQYISYPVYDWSNLRKNYPNKYEHKIDPAPDADSWFHAKVVVSDSIITVYVNNHKDPSLTVKKLNNRTDGIVGFWVGNGSDGDFSNLKITRN